MTDIVTSDINEIGLHRGIAVDAYDAIDAVRSTMLKAMDPTPAHMMETIRNRKPKKCFDLGNAAHRAVLQPDLFDAEFAVAGQCAANTKAGARCDNAGILEKDGAWYCGVRGHAPAGAAAGSRIVLSEDDYRRCVGMREAVWTHRLAAKFLEAAEREVSGIWRDAKTDLLCKFRADAAIWSVGMIGDLKTTDRADEKSFAFSIRDYLYHLSAGFYGEGSAKLTYPIDRFYFLVVETERPHGVNFFQLREEVVIDGWRLARERLDRYAECKAANHWPCYSDDEKLIGLPDREMRQLAFQQTTGGY